MGYAIATLMGLAMAYNNMHDTSIFDGIVITEGMDSQILEDEIFHRCGEFSVSHTDYEYMHHEILHFFQVHLDTFTRMWNVLHIEYNPLENYDRNEYWLDKGKNEDHSGTESTNKPGTISTTKRAAFNSSSFENYEQNSQSGTDVNESKFNGHGYDENEHRGRIHGNIGVTTSQQMLASEWNDVAPLNVYRTIADYFADTFCIQCY